MKQVAFLIWSLVFFVLALPACSSKDSGSGSSGSDSGTDTSDTTTPANSDSASDDDTGSDSLTSEAMPWMWVVGSHPDYQWGEVPASQVPLDHLTHLFLSFLEPVGGPGDYRLDVTGYGPSTMEAWSAAAKQYIEAAHAAKVQVLVDIGGEGGADSLFVQACASSGNVAQLAQAIADTLQDIGFDGVDLDWEGAGYDGACAAQLLSALRDAWPNGILTTAVGPSFGDNEVAQVQALAAAEPDIDAVMLMTYIPGDQTWTWWVVPVPLTPLHGTPAPWGGLQNYSIDRELAVWTAAGVPASKLVMGIGGFGLAWGDTNGDHIAPNRPYDNYDALAADPTCSNPPWTCAAPASTELAPIGCTDNYVTQIWVDRVVEEAGGSLALGDDEIGGVQFFAAPSPSNLVAVESPCGGSTAEIGLIFYETPSSIRAKVAYASAAQMKGLEFWTLSQTRDSAGGFPIIEAARP